MNIGLYQSAASLTALERWQDVVSQNISSGQVTGFKKRTVEFSGVPMGQIAANNAKSTEGQAGVLPMVSFGISFQPGETYPTGNSLDLAISGPGFIKVQTENNGIAYSRGGALHVTPDRKLVTQANQPVLSESGTPLTLQADLGEPAIAADGTVSQGDTTIGKIGVFQFANNADLKPMANGLFDAGSMDATPVQNPNLMQGYLEGSNVSPLREMVSLVEIARAYEANQKVVTSADQTLEQTIQALG